MTGFNKAYLIDTNTRDKLIASDPSCDSLIKRNLRGQDFSRWALDWGGYWLICVPSSENKEWPWSAASDQAEAVFSTSYPSLYDHFCPYRDALMRRQDKGRFWWELRSCAYWSDFDKPKIMYLEITWRSSWCLDFHSTVCNNTAYFVATIDTWVLAVANSPAIWWFSWRAAVHGKDEALRFIKDYVRDLPIPPPTAEQRTEMDENIKRIIGLEAIRHQTRRDILDWLQVEYEIEKPTKKLKSPIDLDSDAFVAEVKKVRGKRKPLTAAGLKGLRDEYARSIEPAQKLAAEAVNVEHKISDLVNEAYGLTPDEIALMWKTAPPRMPISGPTGSGKV